MSRKHRSALLVALALVLTLAAGCQGAGPAADQSTYDGIPVGLTEEGYAYMGSLDAPVTIQEFTDYLCPYCARHVLEVEPDLIEQYVRTGQALLVFRDNPIAGLHPTSSQGHQAAVCVAEQGAALFWEMHHRLFSEQSTWGALADPTEYLEGVVKEVGANVREFESCVQSGRAAEAVNATIAEAGSYGYSATPMFRLTSESVPEAYTIRGAESIETFQSYLDALVAGEPPDVPVAEEPAAPQLPLWARPEGLAADPGNPGYTMVGDAFKGETDAPLTVVEFSDFQCPVCGSHMADVQPTLDDEYVATGKVRWVYKHLPLRIHPQAAQAAAAAECAGEQGQFWPMHDLLFEQVERWSIEEPDGVLAELAGEMGLDAEAFGACLSGRGALERVLADLYDAQDVGNSTPLFVVLYGGSGQIINGSLPLEQFQTALDEMLEQATATP